ncbi:MAG: hypothetical protein AAGA48_35785, partial [Myxococcota bacterium]
MADELQWIRAFVERLVRRERALVALRVAASTAVLLLLALGLAVAAVALRLDRAWTTFGLLLVMGIGGWFAIAWPLLTTWRDVADPLRQARHVEAQHPDFRGRLVTALDLDPDQAGPLAGLVVRRARQRLTRLSVTDLLPAHRTFQALQVVGLLWLFGLPLLWQLSDGFSSVGGYFFSEGTAQAAVIGPDVARPEDVARVGDIVIRYTYPDYTGLEPKTVSNSTGDVQGPPGTRVEISARSARPVEAAGLLAYGEALEAQIIENGRVVTGRFSIRPESGTY